MGSQCDRDVDGTKPSGISGTVLDFLLHKVSSG